nr:hypothetical protein [Tanacetum cinerariifolium]
ARARHRPRPGAGRYCRGWTARQRGRREGAAGQPQHSGFYRGHRPVSLRQCAHATAAGSKAGLGRPEKLVALPVRRHHRGARGD